MFQDEKTKLCPNNLICGPTLYYQIHLDCWNGVCLNCDISFGDWCGGRSLLDFEDNVNCCICLQNNMKCVIIPSCQIHGLCLNCFKRMFCSVYEDCVIPPDRSKHNITCPDCNNCNKNDCVGYIDEFDCGESNCVGECDKFNKECDKYDEERTVYYKEQEKLRKCPLCRE